MMETLLLVATGVLATLGFALIALSQKQHLRLAAPFALGAPPTAFWTGGAILIGLAALPAVLRDGLALGLLLWATMLTVAALLVVVWLTRLRGFGGDRREGRKTDGA